MFFVLEEFLSNKFIWENNRIFVKSHESFIAMILLVFFSHNKYWILSTILLIIRRRIKSNGIFTRRTTRNHKPWNQVFSESLNSPSKWFFFWLSTNKNFNRLLSCTHQINSCLSHFIFMHGFIHDLCLSFYSHFLPFSCLITFTYIYTIKTLIHFLFFTYISYFICPIASLYTYIYTRSNIHSFHLCTYYNITYRQLTSLLPINIWWFSFSYSYYFIEIVANIYI